MKSEWYLVLILSTFDKSDPGRDSPVGIAMNLRVAQSCQPEIVALKSRKVEVVLLNLVQQDATPLRTVI